MATTELKPLSSDAPSSSSSRLPAIPIKLLSYNIDGLNDCLEELPERLLYILGIILSQNPDLIHLQEVTLPTVSLLVKGLCSNGYLCSMEDWTDIKQVRALGNYFTLSFVKRDKFPINTVRFHRISFTNQDSLSKQGRDVLETTFQMDGVKFQFLNCHLESCGTAFRSAESATRQAQLKHAFSVIGSLGSDGVGVIAGDLNIRDTEATFVRKGFQSIADAAEVIALQIEGKATKGRLPVQNTWIMPGKSSVQCRFDRCYYNNYPGLKVKEFSVVGNEPVLGEDSGCGYQTPSDHYGIVITFDLTATEPSAKSAVDTVAKPVTKPAPDPGTRSVKNVSGERENLEEEAPSKKRPKKENDANVIDLT